MSSPFLCLVVVALAVGAVAGKRPPPPPPQPPTPLEIKYSTLKNKTCAAVLEAVPVLPTADADNFMKAYQAFNGTQNETDVINLAGILLSRTDVTTFLSLPDSFGGGGLDSELVLCAVLSDATPAGLANFSGMGKAQEALVDSLFSDIMLMRDMLLAGGASANEQGRAQYGQAMAIYTELTKASAVLSSTSATFDAASAAAAAAHTAGGDGTPWDDRSQTKVAIIRRLALGTAVEHAVPVVHFMTQTITPPWGPTSDYASGTAVDPVARFLHYENAYLAGELDPAFEVLTAFEMRHTSNAPSADSDLQWLRETMANTRPDNIAEPERGSGLADYSWRYSMAVHTDVGYGHPACPLFPGICTGHYTQIPATSGECGPRAFFGRVTRWAFGLPVWGATQPGHAAMTSWSPSGWSVMLGANWQFCWWSHGQKTRGGLDFHLETLAREVRPQYQQVLRGGWAAAARGDAAIDQSWSTRTNEGYGVGGLWPALMLYQQKAVVAAHSFPNGTSMVPARTVGPSVVPTRVSALIAKWPKQAPAPKVTTDADGTITIPAAAFKSTLSQEVLVMKSMYDDGEQLLHADIDPNSSAVVYEFTADTGGTHYLTVNHSTWHMNQYLFVSVNAARKVQSIPVYFTIGYWNESQPIEVDLVQGTNTLKFTREGHSPADAEVGSLESAAGMRTMAAAGGADAVMATATLYKGITFKEFFLFKNKPAVRPPPGNYTPQPVPDESDYILESAGTSCLKQGILDVPLEFCGDACTLAANLSYSGKPAATVNVSGCFVFTDGPNKGQCHFNSNLTAACVDPPCTIGGIVVRELCLRK